jgi:hypothetical protein
MVRHRTVSKELHGLLVHAKMAGGSDGRVLRERRAVPRRARPGCVTSKAAKTAGFGGGAPDRGSRTSAKCDYDETECLAKAC